MLLSGCIAGLTPLGGLIPLCSYYCYPTPSLRIPYQRDKPFRACLASEALAVQPYLLVTRDQPLGWSRWVIIRHARSTNRDRGPFDTICLCSDWRDGQISLVFGIVRALSRANCRANALICVNIPRSGGYEPAFRPYLADICPAFRPIRWKKLKRSFFKAQTKFFWLRRFFIHPPGCCFWIYSSRFSRFCTLLVLVTRWSHICAVARVISVDNPPWRTKFQKIDGREIINRAVFIAFRVLYLFSSFWPKYASFSKNQRGGSFPSFLRYFRLKTGVFGLKSGFFGLNSVFSALFSLFWSYFRAFSLDWIFAHYLAKIFNPKCRALFV